MMVILRQCKASGLQAYTLLLSAGFIFGKYCREILQGNTAGKYCREILEGNTAGKYCKEILQCISWGNTGPVWLEERVGRGSGGVCVSLATSSVPLLHDTAMARTELHCCTAV